MTVLAGFACLLSSPAKNNDTSAIYADTLYYPELMNWLHMSPQSFSRAHFREIIKTFSLVDEDEAEIGKRIFFTSKIALYGCTE